MRRARGFTLIEMMAVVFFASIAITAIFRFHQNLTYSSQVATARTQQSRRAVAILDRVARDLQLSVLVQKPEEEDPLNWPWVFYAEAGFEEGSDRMKFVTRGRMPRYGAVHESDLEVVAYTLEEVEDGSYELLRWSSPRLPEELDREIPGPDDEGSVLLARDIARFGVRFLPEEGEWVSEWDSSQIVESGALPVAAEISVAVYPQEIIQSEDDEEEIEPFVRVVELPVRPIEHAYLLGEDEEGTEGEEEDEEGESRCGGGMTIRECLGDQTPANVPDPDACFADWAVPPQLESLAGNCR